MDYYNKKGPSNMPQLIEYIDLGGSVVPQLPNKGGYHSGVTLAVSFLLYPLCCF